MIVLIPSRRLEPHRRGPFLFLFLLHRLFLRFLSLIYPAVWHAFLGKCASRFDEGMVKQDVGRNQR